MKKGIIFYYVEEPNQTQKSLWAPQSEQKDHVAMNKCWEKKYDNTWAAEDYFACMIAHGVAVFYRNVVFKSVGYWDFSVLPMNINSLSENTISSCSL